MPEREKGAVKNPSLALIAFKPRQVLLAELHQKPSSSSSSNKPTFMAVMAKKQQHSEKTLTPEQNIQLLNSVLKYLESNHFSKSLKRLLKESQIQDDSWKASTLDLADIYCKYLENCNHVDAKLANHKELEMQSDELGQHGNAAASQETVSKKKKKKTDEKDNSENIVSHKDTVSEVKLKKQKKKDKNKLTSESLDRDAKQSDLTEEKLKNDNGEIDFKETAKSKDKKKKNKSSTEPLIEDQKVNESKNSTTLVDDKSNSEIPLEESEVKPKEKKKKKEKKSSVTSENGIDDYNGTKKRKRSTSHENESQPIEVPVPEETKRRKIEGLQEAKNVGQKVTADKLPRGEGQGGKESEEENDKVNINEGEKSSINRIGENTKNGVEKSGQRKQQNGSAEPKTVNAFQRVKVDEVQFVDERLQDNSYWAKDGAEIGYGAKAQEILGQVRGRDFRHEKTKKKRGSYRGGQIDLQSHSIKFNYSDEE